jgi:hypothetical protein
MEREREREGDEQIVAREREYLYKLKQLVHRMYPHCYTSERLPHSHSPSLSLSLYLFLDLFLDLSHDLVVEREIEMER